MIFLLIPHTTRSWEDTRMFASYSAAEQAVKQTAIAMVNLGGSEDWCQLIARDGMDELYPVFSYTMANGHLLRETWVLPSS